jgi:hypothetical protein
MASLNLKLRLPRGRLALCKLACAGLVLLWTLGLVSRSRALRATRPLARFAARGVRVVT